MRTSLNVLCAHCWEFGGPWELHTWAECSADRGSLFHWRWRTLRQERPFWETQKQTQVWHLIHGEWQVPLPLSTFNALANGAHEASGMVGLPQDRHHVALHKLPTAVAERAVKPLEVQRTKVVAALHEEAGLGHVTATYCNYTHTHTQVQWASDDKVWQQK